MRVTLLPRSVAAGVVSRSVATLALVSGATILALNIPVLIDMLAHRGSPGGWEVPAGILVVQCAAVIVALWRGTPAVMVGYLALGAVCAVVFALEIARLDPLLVTELPWVANRPLLALVSVGVASVAPLGNLRWVCAGFALSVACTFTIAGILDIPPRIGWGPIWVLVLSVVFYVTIAAIQERSRRKVPDFDDLEEQSRRRALSADLTTRTTATIHDTVLNDLAYIMHAPDKLPDKAVALLRESIATLESADWLTATGDDPVPGENRSRIINEMARLITEFRWRGLAVNVTGVRADGRDFVPGAGEATIDAIHAALTNVLAHSGVTRAEIEVVYGEHENTWMVSDQGAGFDPSAVPAERLGIRDSIVGRIEAVGGSVRVWSAPGAGTTVMITAPLADASTGAPA